MEAVRWLVDPPPEAWWAALGPDPAVLPDGMVNGVAAAEWDAVFAELDRRGWVARWVRSDSELPVPPATQLFDRAPDAERGFVRLCAPTNVVVHVWLYTLETLLFDFDLRELVDGERWVSLAAFVRCVAERTDREVVLCHEGSNTPFATFVKGSWTLVGA